MSDKDAALPSNDNADCKGRIVLERIIVAKSGLNTDDLHTVRLRINSHNFVIGLDEYIELLNVLAENAREFQEARMSQSPKVAN